MTSKVSSPPAVLVLVYNDIRRDARVMRMSRALAEDRPVKVIGIAPAEVPPLPDLPFAVREVRLDPSKGAFRLKYIAFWIAAIWHGLWSRYGAVHCHDVFPLPAAALLATIRRVPLVYDAHELVDHREYSTSLVGRFWNVCHRWGVRFAGHVITPTEERAEFLVERGYAPRRLPVAIMNVAEAPRLSGARRVSRVDLGFSEDDHVVVYQGYVASKRFSVEMVEAFAQLPERHRLVLIGDGPAYRAVEDAVRRLDLADRVRLTGYMPKATVLEHLLIADAGVMLYDGRILNNYYCAPNKLFDYAHFHLPIIANDLPPIRRVLSRWDVGVLVPTLPTPGDLAKGVREAAARTFAVDGFDDLVRTYSWEAEVAKLKGFFAGDVFGEAVPAAEGSRP